MCRQVTCRKCGRPTWSGCGAHVEQVLKNVPPAERCRCDSAPGTKHGVSGSKRTTPKKVKASTAAAPAVADDAPKRRWFRR